MYTQTLAEILANAAKKNSLAPRLNNGNTQAQFNKLNWSIGTVLVNDGHLENKQVGGLVLETPREQS